MHGSSAGYRMEPLESPRVEQVVGVLNRGEDTDGERTDDELDHPSQSFVSEHEDEGTHVCHIFRVCGMSRCSTFALDDLRMWGMASACGAWRALYAWLVTLLRQRAAPTWCSLGYFNTTSKYDTVNLCSVIVVATLRYLVPQTRRDVYRRRCDLTDASTPNRRHQNT